MNSGRVGKSLLFLRCPISQIEPYISSISIYYSTDEAIPHQSISDLSLAIVVPPWITLDPSPRSNPKFFRRDRSFNRYQSLHLVKEQNDLAG